MIGYSLSFCVRDIIEDKVNVLDVDMIVAATAARNDAEWDRLVDAYCKTYWRKNPNRARKAVAVLRTMSLIYQPRIHGQPHPGSANIWEK